MYSSLKSVLERAIKQASEGKGKERHATDELFENQPGPTIAKWQGSPDGPVFQAIKKLVESKRLTKKSSRIEEMLGAIVYVAIAVIQEERSSK
jgi:hypothetical protein